MSPPFLFLTPMVIALLGNCKKKNKQEKMPSTVYMMSHQDEYFNVKYLTLNSDLDLSEMNESCAFSIQCY